MNRLARVWPALVLLLAIACARGEPHARTLTVFAAASLAAPFAELVQQFELQVHDVQVQLHAAGTPRLVVQLREGAPAHVFAAADEGNMQRVVDAGIARTEPVVFARNRLAIVTAPGNPHHIRSLADLARDDLRVVLCGPEVPAGRYARRALELASIDVRSRSDEPSVRAVVTRVELGEADAGVVYTTDVVAASGRVTGVEIAAEAQVEARYPIVCVGAHGAAELAVAAERFVAFVRSPAGLAILQRHGFEAP